MKIAIIGYGGMGGYHAELLHQFAAEGGALTLAGIYDIDPARAELARKNGIRAYASAEEIWADKEVSAVLIAVPNDVHAPYVAAAAAAGKNIICEKPIGLSLKEAEGMYAAAEKAGVLFEVHQNRRLDDDFLTVKKIFESEEIGGVYKIESRVTGANGIPGDWRKKKAQGGGMMLDCGVHLIDQMFQMVPGKTESLYCEYSYIYGEEVDDGCDLVVNFEGGIKYRITVLTDCFRPLPRWQVYGTDGTATVEGWDLSGGITRALEREDKNLVGIKAGNGFTRTMAQRSESSVEKLPLPVVHAEPFAFYKNFVAAAEGKADPAIRKEEVLRVFRMMEAAALSAEKNEVIKIRI